MIFWLNASSIERRQFEVGRGGERGKMSYKKGESKEKMTTSHACNYASSAATRGIPSWGSVVKAVRKVQRFSNETEGSSKKEKTKKKKTTKKKNKQTTTNHPPPQKSARN